MSNILVLYDSNSGNTARMAKHVFNGAQSIAGLNTRLKSVADADKNDVLWCDGLALGSPTNMGTVSWKMKQFWDVEVYPLWGKIDGKIGCAFSSSGGWGGGSELTCMSLMTILINFGFLVFGVPDYVAHQFTLHYGAVVAGEPRHQREIDACYKLGERLGQWTSVFFDRNLKRHPKSPVSHV